MNMRRLMRTIRIISAFRLKKIMLTHNYEKNILFRRRFYRGLNFECNIFFLLIYFLIQCQRLILFYNVT